MERLKTSSISVSNGNIKCPIGKSIFAVTAVANADTGSLKSLHTLFDTYQDLMLAKFESNRLVQKCTKF